MSFRLWLAKKILPKQFVVTVRGIQAEDVHINALLTGFTMDGDDDVIVRGLVTGPAQPGDQRD